MPPELSISSETLPAMPPDVVVRHESLGKRWRDAPEEAKPIGAASTNVTDSLDDADSLVLSAEEGATTYVKLRLSVPRLLRRRLSPWCTSALVHAAVLVALGLWISPPKGRTLHANLVLTAVDRPDVSLDDLETGPAVFVTPLPTGNDSLQEPSSSTLLGPPELELNEPLGKRTEGTRITPQADALAALLRSDQAATMGMHVPKGGGLLGRSPAARTKLAAERGGSPQSEAAVERGLKWLLAHQSDDGGWRFHFDGLPCGNHCRNAGTEGSNTGATALALLPFYGAGYTHQHGPYAEQIDLGLYYLCNRMLVTPHGGDLQEGTMYAQGLATIVLCEAYAMSKDEKLRPYAQQAVDFVLYAQDRHGGGWRYTPGMPGDTTVTGWQLMALKSAQMAGLEVPSSSFILAGKFLDGVQSENGAAYGYRTTIKRPTTSAVGLLCRMYLGWGRTHPAIREGASFFDRLSPSPTDMYLNYYATQLMYHHGAAPWERWNKRMRDYLIKTQANQGHENGSWHFDDQHGNAGGRLYTTAVAILTLEVYYRYLPLYSTRAVDEGF